MRSMILLAYLVMDTWMIVGVGLRITIQLTRGYGIDLLPIITATIAVFALLYLAVTRRPAPTVLIAMSAWSTVGSIYRVVLQVGAHQPLDPIPAVSVALSVAALVVLFLAPRSPEESHAEVHGR